MGGAHHIDVERALQDFGVALLGGAAKRIAGVGKGLVTVETAELQRASIETEAIRHEFRGAEAEGMDDGVVAEGEFDRIEGRAVDVPERDAAKRVEAQVGAGRGRRRRGGDRPPLGIAQRGGEVPGDREILRVVEIDPDANRLLRGEDVRRLDLDAADRDRRGHLQPDVAVDAGVGQVVDGAAEGRDLRVLRPVDLDRQQVVAVLEPAGKSCGEGGVAILVGGDFLAIQVDHGVRHGAVEGERDLLPGPRRIGADDLLIDEGPPIARLVEVGKGKLDGRVRQAHGLARGGRPGQRVGEALVEHPGVVEGNHRTHGRSLI